MYYVLQYLKHFLTATNQHGVHSPFVYNYLTKCLYSKPNFQGSKSLNVLLKSIPYFSIEKFTTNSNSSQIENHILKEFELQATNEIPFDLIYFNYPEADILSIHKENIHNDSMILVENIYQNKASNAIWTLLKKNKMITVSIDTFYCGILFCRKEQVKEHFKIRI